MWGSARRARSNAQQRPGTYGAVEWRLSPEDRIGPLRVRSRAARALRRSLVLLTVVAVGWLSLDDAAGWRQWGWDRGSALWARAQHQAARPRVEPATPQPGTPTEVSAQGSQALPTPAAQPRPELREAQDEPAVVEYAPPDEAPPPSVTSEVPQGPPARLPPVEPDPGDPLQRQAAAVGLHPGLSRALLARLSATDFQNAATAIRTALAETPVGGELVWPRQRRPEHALFRVHFVPGAAPDCRRYVVTVTKDGWSTTALPMERCGLRPPRAQRS
jgi:hypothetical protein